MVVLCISFVPPFFNGFYTACWDLAENEQTKMISFNVDHAFVQEMSIIPEEKDPSTGNNLLIIISTIIVAIIVISIIAKRIRKTSRENKILKEDL